jgi:hypothetical protein
MSIHDETEFDQASIMDCAVPESAVSAAASSPRGAKTLNTNQPAVSPRD